VVLFVGALIGSALAPELLAAPKKDKDAGEFTVEVVYDWGQGYFVASGAIADEGGARFGDYGPILYGALGTIYIDLEDSQRFTITGGTGAYENLTGSGKYTAKMTVYAPKKKVVDEWIYRTVYELRGVTP